MRRIILAFALILASAARAQLTAQAKPEEEFRRKKEAEARYRSSLPSHQIPDASGFTGGRADKIAAESMHLAAIFLLQSDRAILNQPFTAETVTRTVQGLAGHQAVKENIGCWYRDRSGRTRRDQKIITIGPMAGGEITVISDPVSNVDSILDPRRKTARRFGHTQIDQGPVKPSAEPEALDLGERLIEGLICRGTRRTIRLPGGSITVTTDTWYATAIQALVEWTKVDPRFGVTTHAMRKITLADPPAYVFQIPADYTVEFEGPPGPMMHRRTN